VRSYYDRKSVVGSYHPYAKTRSPTSATGAGHSASAFASIHVTWCRIRLPSGLSSLESCNFEVITIWTSQIRGSHATIPYIEIFSIYGQWSAHRRLQPRNLGTDITQAPLPHPILFCYLRNRKAENVLDPFHQSFAPVVDVFSRSRPASLLGCENLINP
jgi:hypothetical protein